MKKIVTIVALAALTAYVACGSGGGGGGTTPSTTSTETKAAADAAMTGSFNAVEAAIDNAVDPSVSPLSVSGKAEGLLGPKQFPPVIDLTYQYECPGGGVGDVTGSVNVSCTETSCTITEGETVTIDFQDCVVTVTQEGTDYDVTMNTSGATKVTTTMSGTVTNIGEQNEAVTLEGSLSGTVDLTGDVTGTANLSGITWIFGGEQSGTACEGTTQITLTEPTESTQTCTVNSTCDGCEA